MATDDAEARSFVDAAGRGSDGVFDGCAHCGQAFERGVRYPVTTGREPDGSLVVRSFCNEACQRAWEAER